MASFLDLPAEVRNVIYELALVGPRMIFSPAGFDETRRRGRSALLLVSKHCQEEAFDMLCSLSELNVTPILDITTWPPVRINSLLSRVKHVVLDGRTRLYGNGEILYHMPSIQSLTLILVNTYGLSHVRSPDARTVEASITKTVRNAPWKVLGSPFWKPRGDLAALIWAWKRRNKSFVLRTEMELGDRWQAGQAVPQCTEPSPWENQTAGTWVSKENLGRDPADRCPGREL